MGKARRVMDRMLRLRLNLPYDGELATNTEAALTVAAAATAVSRRMHRRNHSWASSSTSSSRSSWSVHSSSSEASSASSSVAQDNKSLKALAPSAPTSCGCCHKHERTEDATTAKMMQTAMVVSVEGAVRADAKPKEVQV